MYRQDIYIMCSFYTLHAQNEQEIDPKEDSLSNSVQHLDSHVPVRRFGIQHRVVSLKYTDISEVRSVLPPSSIISLMIVSVRISQTSVYFNKTTRRYISEAVIFHAMSCSQARDAEYRPSSRDSWLPKDRGSVVIDRRYEATSQPRWCVVKTSGKSVRNCEQIPSYFRLQVWVGMAKAIKKPIPTQMIGFTSREVMLLR
jgi:hypothetical protein